MYIQKIKQLVDVHEFVIINLDRWNGIYENKRDSYSEDQGLVGGTKQLVARLFNFEQSLLG